MTATDTTLKAAVVMASAGRPHLVEAVLENLSHQTTTGFEAVLSVPDERSLPDQVDPRWTVVSGTRGLAAQRNAGIDALEHADIVFFFDDDAVVREDYIANAIEFFAKHPDVVGLTGRVLIDGATSGEVSEEAAVTALRDSHSQALSGGWHRTRELYGCNFAYRVSGASTQRFDARLPLYSWLEDHDFARRLMRHGLLANVDDCVIVHRAAASGGRQAHTRLGYSQVMNPVYLWRKGSFPAWLGFYELFRPTAKNVLRSVLGEESAWRRERLRGNAMAARDILRGRLTPERIVDL